MKCVPGNSGIRYANSSRRGLISGLMFLEARLQKPAPTLAEGTTTVWALRQQLASGVTETIILHAAQGEPCRQPTYCPTCEHLLKARTPLRRSVETMVGLVALVRPYFYERSV
jgi:hypothetical protein